MPVPLWVTEIVVSAPQAAPVRSRALSTISRRTVSMLRLPPIRRMAAHTSEMHRCGGVGRFLLHGGIPESIWSSEAGWRLLWLLPVPIFWTDRESGVAERPPDSRFLRLLLGVLVSKPKGNNLGKG